MTRGAWRQVARSKMGFGFVQARFNFVLFYFQ